ncbi:nuclear transport factor 2 family protein [Novosphingobium bradum]|uniref:Nuclear transport factor 2 family protein n=1 Tax=Novosphingobium bradum TaxID=1737444 RepID=A0ABV7IM70_9SPHN
MSEWEAKAAVIAVINHYSGAAARLDIDEFCSVFTPDITFHGVAEMMGQPGPLKGHEGLRAFFGPAFAHLEWLQQQNTITDVVLGPDGKTAKTSTSITENAKGPGADQIYLLARYEDELVLTGDGWKIAKRTLVPHRFQTVP